MNRTFPARSTLAVLLAVAALPAAAQVARVQLPTGEHNLQGIDGIDRDAANGLLAIRQGDTRAIIDWNSFDVGADALVRVLQGGSDYTLLNRVTGGDVSHILGRIEAPGHVFLLNSAGVVFGETARVDVGGLVVSSLGIDNADFLAGRPRFDGAGGSGAIVNRGQLVARDGGSIALLSSRVANHGALQADGGNAVLAAGERITLDLGGDGVLGVSLDAGALEALVENHGLVQADGGNVLLTASATDAVLRTVVNNTGTVRARSLGERDGRIVLLGDFAGGTVEVAGMLDASAPDGGNGGFIETSGAHVRIHDAVTVTTLASHGDNGTWLIDPTDIVIGSAPGDYISGATLGAQLENGNIVLDTSGGGLAGGIDAGDIVVNEAIGWSSGSALTLVADHDIRIDAPITAANGGLVLDAENIIRANAAIDVGTFTLAKGAWMQNAATLPGFAAGDFHMDPASASFLRALGGDGSSNATAYRIADVYGLQGMSSHDLLGAHFALANDIDASGTTGWNCDAGGVCLGFDPVGDAGNRFHGHFDGQNHVIGGLVIDRPNEYHVGLFGYTQDATMRNVGLEGGSVTGREYVGSLVGWLRTGGLENVHTTVDVTGIVNFVGGLVGYMDEGSIKNAHATGDVKGSWNTGGLVGLQDGTIEHAYATGNVEGDSYVGGLVGRQGLGSTEHAYATGNVEGHSFVGGLVGVHTGDRLKHAYAMGNVNGGYYVGGLVGLQDGSIEHAYAVGKVSGVDDVGSLVGLLGVGHIAGSFSATTDANGNTINDGMDIVGRSFSAGSIDGHSSQKTWAELTDPATFIAAGWDISTESGSSAWRIYEGHTTPLLRSFLTPVTVTADLAAAGRQYDGNIAAGTAPHATSISGALLNGTLAYATTGSDAGTYTASNGGLLLSGLYSHQQGYDIGYADTALVIAPRALTVAVDDTGKMYGDADPVFAWAITQGSLVAGDTLQVALTRAPGEDVGTYTIDASGLANGNYVITAVDGILTITPRAITVAVDDVGKMYGDADPVFAWAITQGSLVAGDTLQGVLTRAPGEDVGTYTIDASGLANGNYVITAVDGTLTITPRAITVAADDAGKVYGEDDPAFAWTITEGSLVAGDTLQGVLTRAPGEDVGTYLIDASGLANGNYVITAVDGTLTITPRAITVAADDAGKVYGEDDPAFAWTITQGSLVAGDTLQVVLVRAPGEDVGTYLIDASGLANGNYLITAVDGVLTIDKAPLVIRAADAVRNAGQSLVLDGYTVEGLVYDDRIHSIELSSRGTDADAVPGQYTIVASNARGERLFNYDITYVDGTLEVLGLADEQALEVAEVVVEVLQQHGRLPLPAPVAVPAGSRPGDGVLASRSADTPAARAPERAMCLQMLRNQGDCGERAPE